MTSGPRRIRVACAKCGYDKVRTLAAGDDRTLAQLSVSLRCGGCRAWGKNGDLSVDLHVGDERHSASASDASATHDVYPEFSDPHPRDVHGVCLVCGHHENFRPRWRRGETLASLACEISCPECGADGGAGNIFLRTSVAAEHPDSVPMLPFAANMLAALLWWLGVFGRIIANAGRALLIAAPVAFGITTVIAVGYLAAVLFATALSVPAGLVLRAAEHEYQDAIRHSPKGGHYVRLDESWQDQADEPRD